MITNQSCTYYKVVAKIVTKCVILKELIELSHIILIRFLTNGETRFFFIRNIKRISKISKELKIRSQ